MPDETSARLWDLRAQCESLLGHLTRAQQHLERYQAGGAGARDGLVSELGGLAPAARTLQEWALEAHQHAAELPDVYAARSAGGD